MTVELSTDNKSFVFFNVCFNSFFTFLSNIFCVCTNISSIFAFLPIYERFVQKKSNYLQYKSANVSLQEETKPIKYVICFDCHNCFNCSNCKMFKEKIWEKNKKK